MGIGWFSPRQRRRAYLIPLRIGIQRALVSVKNTLCWPAGTHDFAHESAEVNTQPSNPLAANNLLEGRRERLTTASGAANVNLEAMIFNVNIYRFCRSAMLGSCLVHSWLPWPLGLAFRWLSEGRREGERGSREKAEPRASGFFPFWVSSHAD
jgi:hypothetical protein